MECFFTIIIASHNRADLIKQTIASIQQQTYTNWELLLIDDGSKDNTKSIVSELGKCDNRIKYYFKKNEERCIARNHGIQYARGKYIIFFDSDDLMLDNHLEKMYQYAKRQFNPIISSGIKVSDRIIDTKLLFENTKYSSITSALCGDLHIYVQSTIFRKDIVKFPFFYPDPKLVRSEDQLLMIEMSILHPIEFGKHIGVVLRDHPARSVYEPDIKKYEYSLKKITEILAPKLSIRDFKILGSEYDLVFAYHYRIRKKYAKSIWRLINAPIKSKHLLIEKRYWYSMVQLLKKIFFLGKTK